MIKKISYITGTLILTLASTAEAISFRDYYHGNAALGIPSHEKEINWEIARSDLNLGYKGLTDLIGFEEVPGLTALRVLYLNDNQLTALPKNIFPSLTALRMLYLYNNPIPLTEKQLRQELQLPNNVHLTFKRSEEEEAEQNLFTEIGNADVAAVRRQLDDIMVGKIRGPFYSKINISKIRDSNGNNLLHAAIRDAAERIKIIDGMSTGLSEVKKKAVKEVQTEQKREINDRYMKIISAILSCGEECVQNMLFTSNAEGQQVVDAIFAKLGFNSPITHAILYVLSTEESRNAHLSAHPKLVEEFERKIHMEEAEQAAVHHRPKRALEQAAPGAIQPAEPMVDVESVEKEQEEEAEDRKRQKPTQPEE